VRTRIPWVLVALGATLLVPVAWLSVLNGSFSNDPGFIPLAVVTMAGWSTVGALLASRNPSNPIGWLMIAFGLGFMIVGLGDEWGTYAYETNPGALPLRGFWVWLTNWWFLAFALAIPMLVVLYPTGSVPSPRWRPLVWALIGVTAVLALATMVTPDPIQVGLGSVPNPLGIPSLEGAIHAVQRVLGIGYVAAIVPLCVAAVVVRFRRASGEERRQIRWLAFVTALGALSFGVALVSGFGLGPDETNVVNEIAFYVFFAAVGLGVPIAIGIALLKHHLWDLDVVLKKTLVATVLVVLISGVAVVALLLLGGLLVGPVSDQPALTLLTGVAVGALVWPLLRVARRVSDRMVYGSRATPYEVLTEFSGRMAEAYSTEDVLPRMAAILGEGMGARTVAIWLHVGGELRPAAGWPPAERPEGTRPLPVFAVARRGTFEVRHQGELLGAITVTMPANDPMTPARERLIRDLTSQAGLVLRNVRLIEELRASRRRIVAAVDEGRRRLERNIHDGAQQQLVALAVKLRLAEASLERDPARAGELLRQLQTETNDALENLRDLARGIYPPLLADEGLGAALEAQARKLPVPTRVDRDGVGRYRQEVEASVYFCVLEALQNVTKYAGATHVDVTLDHRHDRLEFEVRDDGVGFEPSTARRGTGLQGMADRIEAVGGSFRLTSEPGRGTVVAGSVPVEPARSEPAGAAEAPQAG
jgi:signal transduction histidine kinase